VSKTLWSTCYINYYLYINCQTSQPKVLPKNFPTCGKVRIWCLTTLICVYTQDRSSCLLLSADYLPLRLTIYVPRLRCHFAMQLWSWIHWVQYRQWYHCQVYVIDKPKLVPQIHERNCTPMAKPKGFTCRDFTVLTMVYLACSSFEPSNENVWLCIYQVCGIQTTQASTNCSHRHRYWHQYVAMETVGRSCIHTSPKSTWCMLYILFYSKSIATRCYSTYFPYSYHTALALEVSIAVYKQTLLTMPCL